MAKLTAAAVRGLKAPGSYGDGDGLALVIGTDGRKAWELRIQHAGKRRKFGLGSAANVSLAQAREKAAELRRQVTAGIDPTAAKREAKAKAVMPTFAEAARAVHQEHLPTWKNAKHGDQWISTLQQHAFPTIGAVPVDQVTGPMVRDVLANVWLTIPETARRLRQRIGAVLDWAHSKGFRPHPLPMTGISKGLPKQPKRDNHHAALAWADVPAFLQRLGETDKAGPVVKALLRFVILTAVRSGEARGARWGEIDLDAGLWMIPAQRMKAGKAHAVPLSDAALDVLTVAKAWRMEDGADALVFPSAKRGAPMSDMALTMLLRRMETGVTAHGFRSSFRDWAAESTNFPREVCEAALAHAVESRVEAAYRRSDLLEKRRALMAQWAGFCVGGGGVIVPIGRRRA